MRRLRRAMPEVAMPASDGIRLCREVPQIVMPHVRYEPSASCDAVEWVPVGRLTRYARKYLIRYSFGAGYRAYCAVKQDVLFLLLTGGDNSSQSREIATAQRLLDEARKDHQW